MERTVLFIAAAAIFAGCSTELDINAPYKDISVVYGLLNMRDSVHLVKINKAYLGEGDAYTFAQIADSNEYRGEDITYAKVFQIGPSGAVQDSFPMRDTLVTDREPGDFYSPDQHLFTFTTPLAAVLNTGRTFLYQDRRYELRVLVKGNLLSSSTPVVNDFTINAVDQDTANNNSRVNLRDQTGDAYVDYEFNWKSDYYGKRYVVEYRFRYDEIRGADTLHKSITQRLGTRVAQDSQNINEEFSVFLRGESFYSTISTVIRSDASYASASRRIYRGLDFLISVANDDFHTYLTLTEPISGIIEDRPAYSNITGAYGVWGSRFNKNVRGKRLGSHSLTELTEGAYTGDLHFCSGYPSDVTHFCN